MEETVHTPARTTACAEMNADPTLSHVPSLIAVGGPLAGLFAEQTGARLAVAARFEEAADLSRFTDHRGAEARP